MAASFTDGTQRGCSPSLCLDDKEQRHRIRFSCSRAAAEDGMPRMRYHPGGQTRERVLMYCRTVNSYIVSQNFKTCTELNSGKAHYYLPKRGGSCISMSSHCIHCAEEDQLSWDYDKLYLQQCRRPHLRTRHIK